MLLVKHYIYMAFAEQPFVTSTDQWFYTSDSEMITFILGLLIGYFGKEHITALLIKAKDKAITCLKL
jgi:hypothetical protein